MSMDIWVVVCGCILMCLFARGLFLRSEGFAGNDATTAAAAAGKGGSNATGVASNAAAFAASVKTALTKQQDLLLIAKYKTMYESTLHELDELLHTHMLSVALSLDPAQPDAGFQHLSQLHQTQQSIQALFEYVGSH